MRRHHHVLIALLLAGLTLHAQQAPEAPDPLSQEQIQQLIREAADKDIENDKAKRNYTYIQRAEKHNLDGDGKAKSTEIRTLEIMVIYEEPIWKLIAKNDKLLSDSDAKKEEEKIQKIIDKRKNESDDDRKKRLEKAKKQQEEGRKFVKEIADAYNFRYATMELFEGRETYVIDADPRPGFEPHMKDAKIFPKFRFRVWIDKAERQWVKLDDQCIDTVSVGLVLARVHKGSNIQIEQTRVNDEVWLPKHVALKLDARVLLFKGLNFDADVTYRDYKKFRTGTKITPLGEVESPSQP